MNNNTLDLLATPDSIRLFWGYKQSHVTQESFNKDLGETFMPGTPAVLAPMGLNGYLPAILNKDQPEKYPDEVALIVYPSLSLYKEARSNHLLGRIYTYSHAGVFDGEKSRGQWPGTPQEPTKHSVFERWAWRVFDNPLDWQKGQSRLICIEALKEANLFDYLIEYSTSKKKLIAKKGVQEMIVMATDKFASVWLHSNVSDINFDLASIELLNDHIRLISDLKSTPFIFRHGNETVELAGEKYIQFKFPRELKYYI